MPESKAHYEWTREHTTRFGIKLNNHTDANIIDHLNKQESKQGYIKNLIRKDISESRKR